MHFWGRRDEVLDGAGGVGEATDFGVAVGPFVASAGEDREGVVALVGDCGGREGGGEGAQREEEEVGGLHFD